MNTPANLAKRRQELESELQEHLGRRAAAKTEDERLKLVPEAVRIMSVIREVDEAIEKCKAQRAE